MIEKKSKRIVTGHSEQGKLIVAYDGPPKNPFT